MIDWGQVSVEIVGISTPIFIYLSSQKRKAKRDNDERHAENKRRLDKLLEGQKYLKPHDHIENEGALQAEGIIRRKNGE